MLDPNLRGAEYVTGWMEADVHVTNPESAAVRRRFDSCIGEALPKQAFSGGRAEVRGRTRVRVVAVGVGDHRPFDRQPWVDVEPASLTEEPRGSLDDHAARYGSMAAG